MMFASHAARLARIDWSKYGAAERTDPPTLESLQRENDGIRAGLRQLAEELASMLGNVDVPTQTRAPLISLNYTPNAPGVSPDSEELEDFFPGIGGVAGDSYHDPASGLVNGAQAGFFQGVLIFQPAINNPNVAANQGQHRIVQIGGLGAGIKFENIYVENLLDFDGNPYSTGGPATFDDLLALYPVGSRIPWHDKDNIPTGWAIMDGVANASGSGINRGGKVGYGYIAGDPVFGTMDADVSIALSGAISGNGGTTSVTISSHSGSGSFNSGGSGLVGLEPSPILEDLAFGSDVAAWIWTSGTGAPEAQNHIHSVAGTDVAGVLGNHTATVTNNTLAGNLSLGTPTTVRPPGVVELWIEKLP